MLPPTSHLQEFQTLLRDFQKALPSYKASYIGFLAAKRPDRLAARPSPTPRQYQPAILAPPAALLSSKQVPPPPPTTEPQKEEAPEREAAPSTPQRQALATSAIVRPQMVGTPVVMPSPPALAPAHSLPGQQTGKAASRKAGSFTLDPPPSFPAYDLSGVERWFSTKGLVKASLNQEKGSEEKGNGTRSSSSKPPKLAPIVLLHHSNSPHLDGFHKLEQAISQNYMECNRLADTPATREQLIDMAHSHRLLLLLVESTLELPQELRQSPQILPVQASQLEDPTKKMQLWRSIQQHLNNKSTLS